MSLCGIYVLTPIHVLSSPLLLLTPLQRRPRATPAEARLIPRLRSRPSNTSAASCAFTSTFAHACVDGRASTSHGATHGGDPDL
jgi:hypothetical protein